MLKPVDLKKPSTPQFDFSKLSKEPIKSKTKKATKNYTMNPSPYLGHCPYLKAF